MAFRLFNPWRQLVGCPYEDQPTPPTSFNCYQLVVYVREICYLIKTPMLVNPSLLTKETFCDDSVRRMVEIHQKYDVYRRVDTPEPSDIMVFSGNHIGVVVEEGVLSAVAEGANQVVYFDWRKMRRFYFDAYAVRLSR